MRAHVIENGRVINTIEVDSLSFMPNLIAAATGGIGWLWNGVMLSPPPKYANLAEGVATILSEANSIANAKRTEATRGASPAEMASWGIKRQEATAHAAGNVLAAPNLVAEATARGITAVALVQRVTENANKLLAAEAAISGRRGAIHDAALAATTTSQLEAIDVNAGWPL